MGKRLYDKFEKYLFGSIIDVGCGDGKWLKYLRSLNQGFELFGVDSDPKNIVKLRKGQVRGESMLLENIHVFIDRRYDTVCCFDTLDDFKNRHGLLRVIQNLMTKDSTFLLKTNNLDVIIHCHKLFETVEKIDDKHYVFKLPEYIE